MITALTNARPGRATRGGWMFVAIFVSWVLVYVVARALLGLELSPAARWAVAAMPVVVMSAVFTLVIRALARADELERLIHLLAAGIALPLIAATALAIAMLQHAGLVSDRGGVTVLWPYLTGFYLLGYMIARAYYHPSDLDAPPAAHESSQA